LIELRERLDRMQRRQIQQPHIAAAMRLHCAPLDFEQVRAVSDFLARIGWEKSSAAPMTPEPHPAP
jgi:hypothetical protein